MNINNIIIIGTTYRLCILIFFAVWPFNHSLQGWFGPLVYQNADLDEYLYTLNLLKLQKENLHLFLNNYIEIIKLNINYDYRTITGPLFPLILQLSNYKTNFPYLLSLICFFSELISFIIWVKFFDKKINKFFILFFALMPIPLIFGLIHSSDINDKEFLTDRIYALNTSPKDVAGAGDSLLISGALTMAGGGSIWEAAIIGSLAAAIQVGRVGNTSLKSKELLKELT